MDHAGMQGGLNGPTGDQSDRHGAFHALYGLRPNRMIGDESLPPDSDRNPKGTHKGWPQWLLEGKSSPTRRYTFAMWQHYKKNSPLLSSGLVGPVALQATVPRGK
jgi:hypothetical protein